jgi:hypothetical protein
MTRKICMLFMMMAVSYAADNPDLDKILGRMHAWYESQSAAIYDMECLGRSVYRELNKQSETVEEIIALRRIYTRDRDQEHEQYIAMSKNGKDLNAREMGAEIRQWQKMGKRRGSTKMPFDPAWQDSYTFMLEGADTLDTVRVWRIAFRGKEAADDLIDGVAYVRMDNYHILRLEAVSSKLPSVIKKMRRVYTYMDVEGYVLPATFQMELHVKVKFIITFADKHIMIEDQYSDYQVNTGLPDSLFTK